MKRLALLVALILAAGCYATEGVLQVALHPLAGAPQRSLMDTHPVYTGEAAFAQYCARCHGADARGTSRGVTLRSMWVQDTPVDVLAKVINDGRPGDGMPGFRGTLTAGDRIGVVQYVKALR